MAAPNMNLEQLLQPQLLNEHELRSVLIERFIRIDNMEQLNKDQLLSLFYRVATPLQQRTRKVNSDQSIVDKCISTKINQLKASDNGHSVKKIKLTNNKTDNLINSKVNLKRPSDTKMINGYDLPAAKRTKQKICWP